MVAGAVLILLLLKQMVRHGCVRRGKMAEHLLVM